MNKIDFLKYTSFPLDSNTLDFMQEMIQTVTKLSAICGETAIIAGCEEYANGTVNEGIVIIEGELYEFKGGTKGDRVFVQESLTSVNCEDQDYDVYARRAVVFGVGSGKNYLWTGFKRLDNIPALMGQIAGLESSKSDVGHTHTIEEIPKLPNTIVPRGLIAMWSGSVSAIPEGWTLCKGGRVDGLDIPDLRGRFVVGYQADTYDMKQIGGLATVTLTSDQMPKHTHYYTDDVNAEKKHTDIEPDFPRKKTTSYSEISADGSGRGYVYYTSETGKSMAHENRPPYYVLAYIIKL